MKQIYAPFTPEQVQTLNAFQQLGTIHPFTCGLNRTSKGHRKLAKARGDRDSGILVATPAGWVCPACRYTQKWAHELMADPVAVERMESQRLANLYGHLLKEKQETT